MLRKYPNESLFSKCNTKHAEASVKTLHTISNFQVDLQHSITYNRLIICRQLPEFKTSASTIFIWKKKR